MAWTTPRTWVAGEVPTAAIFNTHVRDNLNAIGRPVWGFGNWTATFVADNSYREYTTAASSVVTAGGASVGASGVITPNTAGVYEARYGALVPVGSTGTISIGPRVNAGGVPIGAARAYVTSGADTSHNPSGVHGSFLFTLAAGHFLQLGGWYTAGGNVTYYMFLSRLSDG